ncbi:hypothetical protein HAV15_012215 [Penicillium sp. str. |nr:hypothetical protein HAV15_012215 [Penicillium sp. str. \
MKTHLPQFSTAKSQTTNQNIPYNRKAWQYMEPAERFNVFLLMREYNDSTLHLQPKFSTTCQEKA